MKIVYRCYGRAHSSVVASAIHLGRLRPDKKPTYRELCNLKFFDATEQWDIGIPTFMGRDEKGREVFTLGLGTQRPLGQTALESLAEALGCSMYDVVMVDTLGTINWSSRIGGFLSRALKLVPIGRPLVASGIRGSFGRLASLVEGVKRELERIDKEESHLRYRR